MARFIDIHAEKRKALNLFQAVEPCVELVGQTVFDLPDSDNPLQTKAGRICEPDEIPGFVARMSHGSNGTPEENIALTKKLLTFNPPHATPFEFMQWVFKITGVSKSCLTQFDRNRIGIGFVQMSGRFMSRSESGFVYTAYAEKPWDLTGQNPHLVPGQDKGAVVSAEEMLRDEEEHFQLCLKSYEHARIMGATKQDARKRLPVAMATGTYVHMNTRSLKTFFNERLRPAAEWEIRRLAQTMFDIVYNIAPAHFEFEKGLLDAPVECKGETCAFFRSGNDDHCITTCDRGVSGYKRIVE